MAMAAAAKSRGSAKRNLLFASFMQEVVPPEVPKQGAPLLEAEGSIAEALQAPQEGDLNVVDAEDKGEVAPENPGDAAREMLHEGEATSDVDAKKASGDVKLKMEDEMSSSGFSDDSSGSADSDASSAKVEQVEDRGRRSSWLSVESDADENAAMIVAATNDDLQ
ncbi:unnamed protein product, partial [Polarella glacialis]